MLIFCQWQACNSVIQSHLEGIWCFVTIDVCVAFASPHATPRGRELDVTLGEDRNTCIAFSACFWAAGDLE